MYNNRKFVTPFYKLKFLMLPIQALQPVWRYHYHYLPSLTQNITSFCDFAEAIPLNSMFFISFVLSVRCFFVSVSYFVLITVFKSQLFSALHNSILPDKKNGKHNKNPPLTAAHVIVIFIIFSFC